MGPVRSLTEAFVASGQDKPVLLVVSDERRVAEAVADLTAFMSSWGLDKRVLALPALEVDPYRGLSPHFDVVAARARALAALLEAEPVVIVAPATALLYRTSSPSVFTKGLFNLRPGEAFDPGRIESRLLEAGYLHEDPVVSPGDFARRGGILDIYPPLLSEPLRLEFVGDELEEIRTFDPESQRTTGTVETASIYPAREWYFTEEHRAALIEELLEQEEDDDLTSGLERGSFAPGTPFALPWLQDFQASVFEYMSEGVLIVEEPAEVERRLASEWERVLESHAEASSSREKHRPEPARMLLPLEELVQRFTRRGLLIQEMDVLAVDRESSGDKTIHLSSQLLPVYKGRVPDFLEEVRRQKAELRQVHVFVGNRGLAGRLIEIMQEAEITAGLLDGGPIEAGTVALHLGHLSHGFVLPELGQAVFSGRDLFTDPPRPHKRRAHKLGRFLSDFRDLKLGDYVVHTEHGIGVFTGLKKVSTNGGGGEFVVLEYQGKDRLYVPVEKLDLLEKYSSSESAKPRLDKLGGTGWERVKTRVRKSMRDMTQELLQLYARRKAVEGHAFNVDSHWQAEFEDSFEYEETPDQAQAIDEVKKDLEAPFPMDRLLCGDVGYGKTEVAMRAAFKAVMDSKQVAVLVPTTVLAFQHFSTFKDRFAPFPVRVEMLSRFRSPKEQKTIVNGLVEGTVDIVVGTHRLLSKDVSFRDLGLMVVDEEQRFGVSHKERLKKLRRRVDCLTMTATPIPRTLNMSLSGIRDLSVIETPPKDRMAIQTHITHLDRKVLAEAIHYELGRGGQVYFVHNRVGSIYSMASFLQKLVPEARIVVGHGQMKESELERNMLRFIRHEFDVLVSTTIIENGLDIPLVNTLIVNRADRFGLAQLYQLRGRVGRSNRRAYAYLLVPDQRLLTPIARRRLAAIREFSDLGAGFRIAALDLELRGAGNLLGGEQHGHIEAVGFDMYVKLLEETVRELSGEEEAEPIRSTLNLKIDLRIPESFVPDTNQRMSIYKRASSVRGESSVEALASEIRDRYGPLPTPVLQLLEYARLRLLAEKIRVVSIERDAGLLAFRFDPESPVDPAKLVNLTNRFADAQLTPGGVLKLPVDGFDAPELLTTVREVLLELSPYA
jgi:transcription-repair coupling factor (superfamily II helicase)